MNLLSLPAFADNYIWMLHDGARAVVVDPGDASPVLAALDQQNLELAAILVTHGVDALRSRLRGPVWGPAGEPIPQPFKPLSQGDRLEVMASAQAQGATGSDAVSVLAALREWKNRI